MNLVNPFMLISIGGQNHEATPLSLEGQRLKRMVYAPLLIHATEHVSRLTFRKKDGGGTGCQFSVLAKECPDGSWGVKHRNPEFHHHNHPPTVGY